MKSCLIGVLLYGGGCTIIGLLVGVKPEWAYIIGMVLAVAGGTLMGRK